MWEPRTPTFSKEYSGKLFVSQQLLAAPLNPCLRSTCFHPDRDKACIPVPGPRAPLPLGYPHGAGMGQGRRRPNASPPPRAAWPPVFPVARAACPRCGLASLLCALRGASGPPRALGPSLPTDLSAHWLMLGEAPTGSCWERGARAAKRRQQGRARGTEGGGGHPGNGGRR
jgi:hypothetical protein